MSEFGDGYAYCLGLFLAHAERAAEYKKSNILDASMWFNGAADHIAGLQVPATLPDVKRQQIEAFRDKCLKYRIEPCAWKDVTVALDEAKKMLLEWDLHCGIAAEKGDWE